MPNINADILVNADKEYWRIDKLIIDDMEYLLDSCIQSYKLSFGRDETFKHEYSNNEINCHIFEKVNGFEEPIKVSYNLLFEQGEFRIRENVICFIDLEKNKFQKFQWEIIKNQLLLKSEGGQLIYLAKTSL